MKDNKDSGETTIKWDGSRMKSEYANISRATFTREEIALLFGRMPELHPGLKEAAVELITRIVLNPFTAKRLAGLLNSVITAYESEHGPLELRPDLPGNDNDSASAGGDQTLFHSGRTDGKDAILLKLIADLKLRCGLEKSFKMLDRKLLANRFLIGIDRKDISHEDLLHICGSMDMPENFLEVFNEHLPDANMIYIGFEESEKGSVYKIYLEFWEKLKKDIYNKKNKFEPVPLHMGFKWDTADNSRGAVARYTCYPLLPLKEILKRVSDIYEGHGDRTSFEIAEGIIKLASTRTVDDPFIYLEVDEENNPRRSFDINLYKANLLLKDIHPFLTRSCRRYSVPAGELNALYGQISDMRFGHLSGGIGRDEKDFLTVYYET